MNCDSHSPNYIKDSQQKFILEALMLNTECKYGLACTCDDSVLHWYCLHCVYVYMCMCAFIYSYTYMCVSCINEPQDITVREKNG